MEGHRKDEHLVIGVTPRQQVTGLWYCQRHKERDSKRGRSEARSSLKQILRPCFLHIEGGIVIRATAPKHITTRNRKITSPRHRIIRSKAAPLTVLPRNQVVQTQGTGLIGVQVLYTTFRNYDSDRGITVFALVHMFTHQAL